MVAMNIKAKCEKCGRTLILPAGPITSPVLLVGEAPGWVDEKTKVPWSPRPGRVGKLTPGDVLRNEMSRAGLSVDRCRRTNLWLHAKDVNTCDKDWHLTQLLCEMLDKKAVLLMGGDVLREFLPDASVLDWTGLEIISPELPQSVKVCYVSINPAVALHDKLGEARLAIQNFVRAAKEHI